MDGYPRKERKSTDFHSCLEKPFFRPRILPQFQAVAKASGRTQYSLVQEFRLQFKQRRVNDNRYDEE